MTTYRRAPAVAEVECQEGGRPVVYLGRLPDGPLIVLEGSAVAIWLAAVDQSRPDRSDPGEDLVDRVAASVGVPANAVREDVTDFLATLVQAGLLEVSEEPCGATAPGSVPRTRPAPDAPDLRSST